MAAQHHPLPCMVWMVLLIMLATNLWFLSQTSCCGAFHNDLSLASCHNRPCSRSNYLLVYIHYVLPTVLLIFLTEWCGPNSYLNCRLCNFIFLYTSVSSTVSLPFRTTSFAGPAVHVVLIRHFLLNFTNVWHLQKSRSMPHIAIILVTPHKSCP